MPMARAPRRLSPLPRTPIGRNLPWIPSPAAARRGAACAHQPGLVHRYFGRRVVRHRHTPRVFAGCRQRYDQWAGRTSPVRQCAAERYGPRSDQLTLLIPPSLAGSGQVDVGVTIATTAGVTVPLNTVTLNIQ